MLDPRRLTTPWASTACHRDSFTITEGLQPIHSSDDDNLTASWGDYYEKFSNHPLVVYNEADIRTTSM
jgi:hypothetical protein